MCTEHLQKENSGSFFDQLEIEPDSLEMPEIIIEPMEPEVPLVPKQNRVISLNSRPRRRASPQASYFHLAKLRSWMVLEIVVLEAMTVSTYQPLLETMEFYMQILVGSQYVCSIFVFFILFLSYCDPK